jgi:uncharacterized protein YeaO (DUF488 family)
MPHALVTLLTSPRRGVLSTPMTPAGSADSDSEDIYTVARDIGVLAPDWVRTGCLYAAQPADAYAVLVMPCLPDATKRHNTYHRLYISVAPSSGLYASYRAHTLSWQDFALRYLAELDAKREGALAQFVEQLCAVPARHRGVLLLGFRQAPGGNETVVRCPRRLLRAWLLDQVESLPEVQHQRSRVRAC